MTALALQQAANDSVPPGEAVLASDLTDRVQPDFRLLWEQEKALRLQAEEALAAQQEAFKRNSGKAAAYLRDYVRLYRQNNLESLQSKAAAVGYQAQQTLIFQTLRKIGSGAELFLTTPTTRLGPEGKPMTLLEAAFADARQQYLDVYAPKGP
jgi:hypothetical protein